MIELNEQKANDLDEILRLTIEKGKIHSDGFELTWYKYKIKPDFSEDYIFHLYSLMKYYNEKFNREWLTLGNNFLIRSNHNTEYFLEHGGYKGVLKNELREDRIKDLTERQLKKNIFQMKYWWWILIFNAIISAIIVKLFS